MTLLIKYHPKDINKGEPLLASKVASLSIIHLTLSRGGGKNACATYFGHISSMEARIFMKFETYVHKIEVDHQPNFHNDPCVS